jgi:hypothetical protein
MGKVSSVARVGQAIWYLPAHLAALFLGLCLACMYVQVIDQRHSRARHQHFFSSTSGVCLSWFSLLAALQVMGGIPAEVVAEKDEALRELRETNEVRE